MESSNKSTISTDSVDKPHDNMGNFRLKTVAQFAVAGLAYTAARRFLRNGVGENVANTLDLAFSADSVLDMQVSRKSESEYLSDIPLSVDGGLLSKIDAYILQVDDAFKTNGLEYDSEKAKIAFTKIAELSSLSNRYSVESVCVIAGGQYPYGIRGITELALDKFVTSDLGVENNMNVGSIFANIGLERPVPLAKPFDGGFLFAPWVVGPKTVTHNGSLVVLDGIAGIDEKFADGRPEPVGIGIHVFNPKGNHHMFVGSDLSHYFASKSLAVTEQGVMYVSYTPESGQLNLNLVEISNQASKMRVQETDFTKIKELFKNSEVLPLRVVSQNFSDNSKGYYWELLTERNGRRRYEIVEQKMESDGSESLSVFHQKYKEVNGADYILLGKAGDTVAILEANSELLFGIVFIDKDGKKHRQPINIPHNPDGQLQYTLDLEGLSHGEIAISVRSALNPDRVSTLKNIKIDTSDELYSKIYINK